MYKRLFARLLCAALCALCLAGCAGEPKTILLNSVSKFFSNEAMLEATARELEIVGNAANVRIHIMNLNNDPLERFGASVAFLDSDGNILYTDEQEITLDMPLEIYDSISITATCRGKNVNKISSVSISGEEG